MLTVTMVLWQKELYFIILFVQPFEREIQALFNDLSISHNYWQHFKSLKII